MERAKFLFNCFTLLFIFSLVVNVNCTFKMTKVICESQNKSLVSVNHCRLRAIRRGVAVFNLNVTILEPVNSAKVNILMLKRANGYKPFLTNVTYDACEYMRKHNHPTINLIYGIWKDFSNINHTCPYVGDQILKDFYLRYEKLQNLPLPNGDYALSYRWIFNKVYALQTSIYFELSMW